MEPSDDPNAGTKGMNVMNNLVAPIDTPAVWHGAALATSDAWRRQLTETEIAALERATEMARTAPCPGFGPAAFPVPELTPLFATSVTARSTSSGHPPE